MMKSFIILWLVLLVKEADKQVDKVHVIDTLTVKTLLSEIANNLVSQELKLVQEVINNDNKHIYDNQHVVIGTLNENQINMNNIYPESLKYFNQIIRRDINGIV